jgi:hypothetical protein
VKAIEDAIDLVRLPEQHLVEPREKVPAERAIDVTAIGSRLTEQAGRIAAYVLHPADAAVARPVTFSTRGGYTRRA